MTKNCFLVLVLAAFLLPCRAQIVPVWSEIYVGDSLTSYQQYDMVTDAHGNTYMSVFYQDTSGFEGTLILKYNSNGLLHWSNTFDTTNYISQIIFDDSLNVYVTGSMITYPSRIYLVKYDSSGIFQWKRFYNNDPFWNWSFDIAIDDSNYIYVGGITHQEIFTTLKYDWNGNLLWHALDSSASNSIGASYITVDNHFNVYHVGRGEDTTFRCNIYKYDHSGNKIYEKLYSGNYNPGMAFPRGVKCDNNGNVYILANTTNNNSGQGDYAVVKYDSLGNFKWQGIFSASTYYDIANDLDVDNWGNVYVTGNIHPGGCTGDAYTTVRFNSSGTLIWSKPYTLGQCNWDIPKDIIVDPDGFIYVTGQSADSSGQSSFATIKYDSLGNELFVARFNSSATSYEDAHSISLDLMGNIYVAGYTAEYTGIAKTLLIKYGFDVGISAYDVNDINVNLYPNPAINNFTISASTSDKISFEIFNSSGELIHAGFFRNSTTVNANNWLPGMYFIRVSDGNTGWNKKLIKQ